MKISKLFHWLYASLMLLPLMVFGVTGLYYGLNQNAQLSERTEQQPVYYQSNEVNDIDDLNIDYAYKLDINGIINDNNITAYGNFYEFDKILEVVNYSNIITPSSAYTYQYPFFWKGNNSFIIAESNEIAYYYSNINVNTQFVYLVFNNSTLSTNLSNFVSHISICDKEFIKEYQPIVYNNDISTSIINAWNSTWQNPLFSWSSESFLIAPFNYITDLFSIPQNNTFSMALSYWLAISIVYLVFDLVMYVPLLAHRWIDKGMVE